MLLIRRIGEVVFKLPCAKPQRNPRHLQTALHSVLTRPLFLGGLSRLFLCTAHMRIRVCRFGLKTSICGNPFTVVDRLKTVLPAFGRPRTSFSSQALAD